MEENELNELNEPEETGNKNGKGTPSPKNISKKKKHIGNKDDPNKKRERDEEEGNSPIKKKLRKSPKTRKGHKSVIKKGRNYNLKYKKAKECKHCEGDYGENCRLCGKYEHICQTEEYRELNKAYVWMWLCKGCNTIMEDEEVLEEIKGIFKREQERKKEDVIRDTKESKYCCCICSEGISKRQIYIICVHCKKEVHLKCSGIENFKEEKEIRDNYACKFCEYKALKYNLGKQNNILEHINENDLKTLEDGRWFSDNIMLYGIDELRKRNNKILFVNPVITQLLKLSNNKKDINETIGDIGLDKAEWVFFPVNNNYTEKSGGSHWSLLVYNKLENSFYHFDPITGANDGSVSVLIKNLTDTKQRIPEVRYVKCPRQKNSFDCGPYTMLFAEKIADNIQKGRDITKIEDCDANKYRTSLRSKILRIVNANKGENDKKKEPIKTDEQAFKEPTYKEKECWHYTNRKCKFGETCRYKHKEPCIETLENGYCYNDNCRKGHPRICREIYDTGRCKRSVCKYFHPYNLRNGRQVNESLYTPYGSTAKMYNSSKFNRRHTPMTQMKQNNWNGESVDRSFLGNQSHRWENWIQPIMDRAVGELRDQLWDYYHQGTRMNNILGK